MTVYSGEYIEGLETRIRELEDKLKWWQDLAEKNQGQTDKALNHARMLETENADLRNAANRLIDYCIDHDWGTMPEPYGSINPLLLLLGRGKIEQC